LLWCLPGIELFPFEVAHVVPTCASDIDLADRDDSSGFRSIEQAL